MTTTPPPIAYDGLRHEGCTCWYDRTGRLILWAWRCPVHPGAGT